MNRTVLIIGGAGYIGPVITDQLLCAGYSVNCLDLLLYENGLSITSFLGHPQYRFLRGDLVQPYALEAALVGVTDVVLLAGLVGDPIAKKYPAAAAAINDKGTIECIDKLNGRGIKRVVFVSTCSNYGLIAGDELADELHPVNPLSSYAKSKLAAEAHLLSKKGRVDYSATILRFATAFGLAPRMRFDLTVNEFTRELALDRELLVFDADTWRPYCHVRDFARLIQIVLEAPAAGVDFEVFNAGGEINNQTKRTIVRTLCEFLPAARVIYGERGSDARNYRVNFSKVRKVLGFEPQFMVRDGISELLDALRSGIFERADEMRTFHGNYELEYPIR